MTVEMIEGRPPYVNTDPLMISGGTLKDKPIVWIDSGIHARECISVTTAVYIATQLVEKYNSEKDVKLLVDSYEWYILPCVNPDGYEYSHTKMLLSHRSTRSEISNRWHAGCMVL
ncbi:carboxypeptidase A2-like [Tachypleus tridentatus]|uniref:carboxypeptidase A2-like n=1 Tax=Tachypleus tridentatus TaxID=6853 RepID=UPI003FD22432